MSRSEFIIATVSDRGLTGNGYWWKYQIDEFATPTELWVIPSHKMRPVPDERLFIKGYLYDPGDGQEILLKPWEVVHFREYHPLSPFVGLSPIEALSVIAIGDMKMQDWNTRLFAESNARLPGILAFADPIPDSEWDKLQSESVKSAAKRQLIMLRNVGKGGVQWMQQSMSQRDMEFIAGRQFTKEEIFNIYAPGFVSMTDKNATEANATAGKATYREQTIHPLLVGMAEKITNDLLPSYGDKLKGKFEDVRLSDRALELQEQQEYAKTHTIDEIREKFYGDVALEKVIGEEDERGLMFPSQIGAGPVGVGEPEPVPDEFMGGNNEPKEEEAEEPEEEVADDENVKAELSKWQRKAIAKVKKGDDAICNFESGVLPVELRAKVMSMLTNAKNVQDVEVVFNAVKSERFDRYGDFAPLVSALQDATMALREGEQE